MRGFALGMGFLGLITAALAGVSALVGALVAHFAGLGPADQGAGWGMTIGGALVGLLTGQSGSPSRMAAEGRWGFTGQFWGSNPALPQNPLWLALAGVAVLAGGIAILAVV